MIDKLLNGDSLEVMRSIADDSIDSIISDIPYGIGFEDWDVLHSNTNSALGGASAAQKEAGSLFKRRGKPLNGWSAADKRIPIEYQEWCGTWAPEWLRVLKPGATCFVFAGRRFAHRCIAALEDAGFNFKDMLAWEKPTAAHRAQRISEVFRRRGNEECADQWEGWRVANLRPLFEPILWFQKPYKVGGTLADNVLNYNVGAWNEKALEKYTSGALGIDGVSYSNIIRVANSKDDHGLHPAQKPLLLMKLLIELVTGEGAIVLDPFMGSGTTCVAANQLGRHYIGIDLDPACILTAEKRLFSQQQLFNYAEDRLISAMTG
jgi:site-specific DNA-methyltransferase (adenine-specific)